MQLDHGDRRPSSSQRLPVNSRRHRVAPEHRKRVAAAQCASTARDCVYPAVVDKVSLPRAELEDLRKKIEIYERALQDAVADPTIREELLHHAASPESSLSTSPFANAVQSGFGQAGASTSQPSSRFHAQHGFSPRAHYSTATCFPGAPMPVGDEPVLYDELVTWMGGDWSMYSHYVNELEMIWLTDTSE
ncbi:C6 transcription factor [Metarhizium rileyi]|uniref:C6 transcription factor n=1 Tax=Metarhizium rileyi (strain RCEF 4871) TaxID=1649241 RepID=A0A167KBZ6_METRR|nr:C6 transcription factor [Metarhizium rileyi RCEF 4871]